MNGIVVIVVIAAVIAVALIMGKKRPSGTSTTTPPISTPGKRPAPEFGKPISLDHPRYGKGQRIVVSALPETHGCDGAVGYAAQTQGIFDNGSGPYTWRLRVRSRKSGTVMPVYEWNGQFAELEKTDQIVPQATVLCFYVFGKRPWKSLGTAGACNEFTPLPGYEDVGESKTTAKACPTCPGGSGSTTTDPEFPSELIVVEVTVWNADGVAEVYKYEIVGETTSCS